VTGSVTGAEGVSVAGDDDGTLALRNVTLAPTTGFVLGRYFAGQVTLVNTIVDGACEGTPTSLGHNLESGDTCGLEQAGQRSAARAARRRAGASARARGRQPGHRRRRLTRSARRIRPARRRAPAGRPLRHRGRRGGDDRDPGPATAARDVYVTERSAGTATAFDAATGTVALDEPDRRIADRDVSCGRAAVDKVYTSDEAPTRCRSSTA
jgi:hypothetical protein